VVNEIIPASSARFPWLNNRSRDRSPPLAISWDESQGNTCGLEAFYELYANLNAVRNGLIPNGYDDVRPTGSNRQTNYDATIHFFPMRDERVRDLLPD
jgi:hypothetical protein